MQPFSDDWMDLLAALQDAEARFLIVGAHALAVHGVPRGTQDLDLWIDRAPENAARVWQSLRTFGAPLEAIGISRTDLELPDLVIQLGVPPNRIDLLTSLSGLASFASAWDDRTIHFLGSREVPVIGRRSLLVNKRAAARTKDLADIEALGDDD